MGAENELSFFALGRINGIFYLINNLVKNVVSYIIYGQQIRPSDFIFMTIRGGRFSNILMLVNEELELPTTLTPKVK